MSGLHLHGNLLTTVSDWSKPSGRGESNEYAARVCQLRDGQKALKENRGRGNVNTEVECFPGRRSPDPGSRVFIRI
jgi:hypothetical protein